MEEKGEKINCECGSVVLKKNLASHAKTKKHQACLGPPSLHRGVSFADAQQSNRADDDDDEDDEEEEGEEMDELFDMLEEVGKAIMLIDNKVDNLNKQMEDIRLKTNSILGEVRDVSLRLPFTPFGVIVKPTGSSPSEQ